MRPIRAMATVSMCAVLALAGCTSAQQSRTPVADGSTAVDLYTHCGIRYLQIGVDWFERVGGPLDDAGNPPSGWANPTQPGRVTVTGDIATFTDDAGHKESFKKLENPPSSETNCA